MSLLVTEAAVAAKPRQRAAHPYCANAALATLPAKAFTRLMPFVSVRDLAAGAVLAHRVYFPLSGIASAVQPMGDEWIEVGKAGRDAFVVPGPGDAYGVVLATGKFASFDADAFVGAAGRDAVIGRMFAAGTQWLLVQARRLAACNAMHSCEARICRWLIEVADRATHGSRLILATHDMIALTLGVRRSTVTAIVADLRAAGAIISRRGNVTIRDRVELERRACDCAHALGPAHWPFGKGDTDG